MNNPNLPFSANSETILVCDNSKVKIQLGTCHFPSVAHAESYYMDYIGGNLKFKEASELVRYKLKKGEIHIGKPELKSGQELRVVDFRYHICDSVIKHFNS